MTFSRTTWLWILLLTAGIATVIPDSALSEAYLRGGVLLDRAKDTRLQDSDCSSEFPKALYGCEAGNDGASKGSLGDFETMAGWEIGLGYPVLPALRLELAVQYRPEFSFRGRANFDGGVLSNLSAMQDVSAELSVWSGMLATYLDVPLPGFALFRYTPINPFIGIGGGLSRIDISDLRMDFPVTSMIVPGDRQVSFSWMLSAGLAVSLAKWTVDVAWRYTHHGDIETAAGIGRRICRIADCQLPEIDLPLAPTIGDLKSHGFTLSLRYAF